MSSTTLVPDDDRTFVGNNISRLPSPTPSEIELLNTPSARILSGFHKSKTKRPWYFYVIVLFILTIVILFAVFQKNIVHWLEPGARKVKNLPGGFLIPIAIFIILSIPPLFGQEIIAILVGLVWGLWVGFAITAAGTLMGETIIFFAFKYFFRSYGEKLEKRKVQYAALARIIREGGLVIAVVVRYSVIPNHFVTALFAVSGVNLWVFLASAILSLPLYLVSVFLGQALEDEEQGKNKTVDNIVNYTSLFATIAITYAAMFYLGRQMDRIKADLILQRRKERQVKLSTNDFSYDDESRTEMGRLMETGSEYERPAFGGQYTPVNNGGAPYSTPAYPSSSYAPDPNALGPYSGGYTGSVRTYNPPPGPPPSRFAPNSSDEASHQNYDNRSTDSFNMQEMPPRTVPYSIP